MGLDVQAVRGRLGRRIATPLVTVLAALAFATPALGQVVISQVYGGGGNSGATYTHDFIELFNRGATMVDLTGWSVQYASATGSTWQKTDLAGSIAPGGYYLVQQARGAGGTTPLPTPDATGTIAMAATAGKVALVSATTALSGACPADAAIQDFVGFGSTANCFEGGGPTPAPSNTTAAVRVNGGCVDTNDNAADFRALAPTPRNSESPRRLCTAPALTCAGVTSVEGFSISTTVTASDPDGTVVDVSITSVTPDPGSITRTDFTPASGEGETARAVITVGAATPPGSYSVDVAARNNDDVPETATCRFTVTVLAILPIGVVQGVVNDTDNGFTHRSPFAPPSGNSTGQTVAVRGVVHSRRLGGTSAAPQYGLWLQNTFATRDGDPRTSDGIFVFMGSFSTLLREGGGTYTPRIGDEIVLTGRVSEFFNLTQLSSTRVWSVERSGVDLETELETFVTDPPDNLDDAGRYWERRESMRARVPAATLAVSGRDVFGSDADVWVIRSDHPVALRADPYARRVFRDPHPLDNRPDQLFDDGNGYRILLASNGIKATTGDADVHIAPARTYDTVTNSPTGVVDFTFGKYAVQVEQQIVLVPGVDPALNAPPQAPNRAEEYSAASFNVENLYDYRDDPFDGCDFEGNAGCPGVRPPFNYVPGSEEDYQQHLGELAAQIVNDLHSPDVILVQEAEDQDICAVAAGALACGTTNDADGRPDTLQELALAVRARGGPAYAAVADRDGADDRGIISAFMFRTDRVELLPADVSHPVLGSNPQVSYRSDGLPYNTDVQNPKVLNAVLPADVDRSTGTDGSNVFTRPPQVGLFRISPGPSNVREAVTLYALSNHFSSGPDRRVGQRREQARYNAAITAALEAGEPGARVLVGGDLNVFPRPDDPFAPGHPLFPSDQLAPLYDQGLYNLYDSLVAEVPVSAYSYIFQASRRRSTSTS